MQYGTRVSSAKVIQKTWTVIHSANAVEMKVVTDWYPKSQRISSGIYLGKRSLPYGERLVANGIFKVKGHKTVALVSPDGKRNPVYVDIKDLEVMPNGI
jgi:hypothetical protein